MICSPERFMLTILDYKIVVISKFGDMPGKIRFFLTQDAGFYEFGLYDTFPARVIWLRCGKKSNTEIISLLAKHKENLIKFAQDEENWCLEIK